jgi:hypothetical protein
MLIDSPDMKSRNNIPISASNVNSTEEKSNLGSEKVKFNKEMLCPENATNPIPPKIIPAIISPITAGCFNLSNTYPKTLANMRAKAISKTTSNTV